MPENETKKEQELTQEAPSGDATKAEPAVQTDSPFTPQKLKLYVKILFLAAIICLFMPFASVSCSGQTYEANGLQLAVAQSGDDEINWGYDAKPNTYILVMFLSGFVSFFFTFSTLNSERAPLYAAIFAVLCIVLLILFRVNFVEFYELDDYVDYIKIKYLSGWWLSLMTHGLIAVISYKLYESRNKT